MQFEKLDHARNGNLICLVETMQQCRTIFKERNKRAQKLSV